MNMTYSTSCGHVANLWTHRMNAINMYVRTRGCFAMRTAPPLLMFGTLKLVYINTFNIFSITTTMRKTLVLARHVSIY
jgi:hypothetical protein